MMGQDPMVGVSKVSGKGLVLIPYDMRVKLNLQPGTKMILMVENDLIVLRKAEALFERSEQQQSILGRLRSVFSRLPIRDIED
jgi:AbrB family looped-hinge helix DNA binding protein